MSAIEASVTDNQSFDGESLDTCYRCEKPSRLLFPLHREKGGPRVCGVCELEWNIKFARKRKIGRLVVKVLKAFYDAGGGDSDITRLKLRAAGWDVGDGSEDTIGAEVGDISLELLEDAIRLTHPDIHPPERQELAKRVTQELLNLKPYVFPAPKPQPKCNNYATVRTEQPRLSVTKPKDSKPSYPCEVCIDTVPYYYCSACRAERDKRWQHERDVAAAKQRAYRKTRRARRYGK